MFWRTKTINIAIKKNPAKIKSRKLIRFKIVGKAKIRETRTKINRGIENILVGIRLEKIAKKIVDG